MNAAKYYIYRNLHTGGFSVKYKGRVIDRLNTMRATGVTFKVSEKGRQKVISEKRKNVHAFVVADKYTKERWPIVPVIMDVDDSIKIRYNPYKGAHFTCNGFDIHSAREVVFQNGYCLLSLK